MRFVKGGGSSFEGKGGRVRLEIFALTKKGAGTSSLLFLPEEKKKAAAIRFEGEESRTLASPSLGSRRKRDLFSPSSAVKEEGKGPGVLLFG